MEALEKILYSWHQTLICWMQDQYIWCELVLVKHWKDDGADYLMEKRICKIPRHQVSYEAKFWQGP